MKKILKRTPLSAVYRSSDASVVEQNNWEVADHFGDSEKETTAAENSAVLVDWSHIGKIYLQGHGAENQIKKLSSDATQLHPLGSYLSNDILILRLTSDEFFVVCPSGKETQLLNQLEEKDTLIADQTGAYGALMLAGPGSSEVMQRSSALNFNTDIATPGSVVQTTVHFIPSIVVAGQNRYLFLQTRDYTQSLHKALLDVGTTVNLIPAGIKAAPVDLGKFCKIN